jgi:hypothetical protein
MVLVGVVASGCWNQLCIKSDALTTSDFSVDRVEYLQTPRSKAKGQAEGEDGDPDSHGTSTACNATGHGFGAAKGATLVVVQLGGLDYADGAEVYDWVWQDIKKKNQQRKSVVTYSITSTNPVDPNNLDDEEKTERDDVATSMRNDVIVVVSARNFAEDKDSNGNFRKEVEGILGHL